AWGAASTWDASLSAAPMTLNYWKQSLAAVPDVVWTTNDLDTLILADTGLTTLPDAIGRLPSVRPLDLGHNALAALPDALGDLTGLTNFLSVPDTRLTRLPET